MSKRTSTARYTLPLEINPATTVDFCVRVPNDIYHIGAFLGQIYALSRAYSWQNDSAHSALLVAAVWRKIFDNLKPGNCGNDGQNNGGADEGVEQLIRQNPDHPCLLETSINGTDWCVFADLSLCVAGPGQPGSGTPQPKPGGGEQCYHAKMTGSNKWLLPTNVNTGDVITVSNYQGAASDGTVVWYCGNGAVFQLGACFGSGTTSGGDPLNTSSHMMLIAKIGSTYYPMYNTSLTVPGGVSGAQVTFQLNDSNLADNFGDVSFDVCVTNNQAAPFSHTFDFTLTDGGFTGVAFNFNDAPSYIPGVGWDSPDETNAAGVSRTLTIKRTGLASRTFTGFSAHYSISDSGGSSTTEAVIAFPDENGASGVFYQSQTNGNGNYNSGAGFSHADTALAIRIQQEATNPSTVAHCHIVLTSLTISGLGTDPF